MAEIELDDEREEAAQSKHCASNDAANSALKTSKVTSVVSRDKIQKLVASGLLCDNTPLVEKAKKAVIRTVKIFDESTTINNIESKLSAKPDQQQIQGTQQQTQEKNEFPGVTLSFSPLALGTLVLRNACNHFIRLKDYSMNIVSDAKDLYGQLLTDLDNLYLETKEFFSNIYKKCLSSLANFYNNFREAVADSVKFISKLFESKEPPIIDHYVKPFSTLAEPKYGDIKAASSGYIQNAPSSIIKDYQGEEPISKKLKNILENLSQAFAQKEQDKKLTHEQEIIQQQIKLSQEADRAFNEALSKRPDLASKLTRPQLAFLAGSPFAKLPSAEDLIEQAEKTPTIH